MIICPWSDIKRYESVIPGLAEAIEFVNNLTNFEPATYPLSGGNKILVQQGTTKAAATSLAEAHREYLDIQYVVKGHEYAGWAPLSEMQLEGEFDTAKDKGKYSGNFVFTRIDAGKCYVVYPEDGHMPGVHLDTPSEYTKLVIKLKV